LGGWKKGWLGDGDRIVALPLPPLRDAMIAAKKKVDTRRGRAYDATHAP